MTSGLLACSLLANPACGQSEGAGMRHSDSAPAGQSGVSKNGSGDETAEAGRKRGQNRGKISGEIVRTKLVDVRGTKDRHLLLLLETERGNRVPIDLGPSRGLKGSEIKSGQNITAFGKLTSIGEKQLIIAEALRIGDQRIRIPKRRPLQRWHGTVEGLKMVQLPGVEKKTALARVKTKQGQIVFAVLGDESTFQGTELESGDEIEFMGRPLEIKNRSMIVVHRMAANGKTLVTRQQGRPDTGLKDESPERRSR